MRSKRRNNRTQRRRTQRRNNRTQRRRTQRRRTQMRRTQRRKTQRRRTQRGEMKGGMNILKKKNEDGGESGSEVNPLSLDDKDYDEGYIKQKFTEYKLYYTKIEDKYITIKDILFKTDMSLKGIDESGISDKILTIHKLYTIILEFLSDPRLIIATSPLPVIGKSISDLRSDLVEIFNERIKILNMTNTIKTSVENNKTIDDIIALTSEE